METIGPATRREALGQLRRLLWDWERPRPRWRHRFRIYARPLALIALIGMGLGAGTNLADTRELPDIVVVLIAAGSVLPILVSARLPVLAWRLAYPMMFLGVMNAAPEESWPWNPVQIFGFLFVLGRLAVTQDGALTAWATTLCLVPVFIFGKDANAWGAAILLVAIAALGDILSRRRRTRELLAEQEELTELERAKRAVLEERARIAREMHDVVAHHMSMIAVRAETAPYRLADELPASAREELAMIAIAARDALTDMRRLLGTLRAETDEAMTAPQPGLADLDDLVATARAAGVDVTMTLDGVARVPETVGLAAYRIMQEALANAARHAPGGPVTIDGRGLADRLELVVRNRRTRSAETGAGHGLIGMRERATLLGGTLTAGPDRFDFVVTAILPYNGRGSA
ncbi:sensor histidine kinase [Paractinoplanes rishiriensis]|uniref:histidine kinase n=1 Tax=Paractinoplanes rishiriensis TaxID=1050105 RepID=A0A919K5M2_9ACTN|nr:histidine kinase [Actinoplanes rishiriensis]GIE97061.1 two-component sensor histidine kinase [Actinoplanes rishiriensis]